MSQLSLEEAKKAFCEDIERELKEDWGKYLTEDEQDEVMHSLACIAASDFEFEDKAWCIANEDRLSIRIRGLVEAILHEAHGKINAFTLADGIADKSANVFNRVKTNMADDPEIGPSVVAADGQDGANDPSEDEGYVEFRIGTNDLSIVLYSPDASSLDSESERDETEKDEVEQDENDEETGSSTNNENIQDEGETADESGDSVIIKEEELDDNDGFCSPSGSQLDDDVDMADHGLVVDFGDGSPGSHLAAGWDQVDGECMAEDLPADEDTPDNGLVDDDVGDGYLVSHPAGQDHGVGQAVSEHVPDDEDMDGNDFPVQEMAGDAAVSSWARSADKEEDEEDREYADNDTYTSAMFQTLELQEDDDSGDYIDEPQDEPQDEPTVTEKGKSTRKGKEKAPSTPRYPDNDLWSVVMDDKNPNGPPKGYKCKIAKCKGFQGGWSGRFKHYRAKHTEEYSAFLGRPVKVWKCLEDGCDFSTTHGEYYLNGHKKNNHGIGATKTKK